MKSSAKPTAKTSSTPATPVIAKKVVKTASNVESKPTPAKIVAKTPAKTVAKVSVPAKKIEVSKTVSASNSNDIQALPELFKTVLISQPEPQGEKSPYHDLAKRYNLRVDFKPFLVVEAITLKEFRKARVNPGEFSAIIFNSRNAIDYFFKICEEMRVRMPQETKYFCASETIALYLQKYIQYRKRKVFYGDGSIDELKVILNKHKLNEKYLLPCSSIGIGVLPEFLKNNGFVHTEAVMYRTVITEFKKDLTHDMITFFNPEGVRAFFKNFPNFKQGNKVIGAFGEATQKLLEQMDIRIHAKAPVGEIKSMTMAIEKLVQAIHLRKAEKKNK